jgi:two-component SAPR family response regulator
MLVMRHMESEPVVERLRLIGLVGLTVAAGFGLQVVAGLPHLPSALPTLQQLGAALAGASLPLETLGYVASSIAWLLWLWLAASIGLELLVAAAEGMAYGAMWVGVLRQVANRVSLPLARRAVGAAFAVQVLARALPVSAAAPPAQIEQVLAMRPGQAATPVARLAVSSQSSATYLVRPGDTLWSIAEAAYGAGGEYRRLVHANVGRRMPDGSAFPQHGVIQPGWLLEVPEPTTWIDSRDGLRVYTVREGDTLSSIAASLLGDQARWRDLFELNRGAASLDGGRVLSEPDLIWPGLRLRIPGTQAAAIVTEPEEAPADAEPAPPAAAVTLSPAPAPVVESPVGDAADTMLMAIAAPPIEPPPLVRQLHPLPPLALEQEDMPIEQLPAPPEPAAEPPLAAAGVAGLAAIGALGLGIHRLRRLRRLPHEAESDIVVQGGYAEAQLTQEFARRLQGVEYDAATLLAGQFRAFLDEYHLDDVHIVAARHGRSSTTLCIAAGLAQQAILVDLAPVYATRLESDVEAWVSTDQDVQLRFDQPRKLRLLQPAAAEQPRLPTFVPIGLLMDRQVLSAEWSSMGNTLVASMPGQGADSILTSLLATLTARRPPSDLRMWLLAEPRTLPAPLEQLPHLEALIDPSAEDGLDELLGRLRGLLDEREQHGTTVPEVLLVIAELTSLGDRATEVQLLATRAVARGVRLVAATSQPDAASHSQLLAHFATRLVLHMNAEETSVALLGVADAAWLGGGGRLMLRLDGREPVELYGYQVVIEHLERLVRVMRASYAITSPSPEDAVIDVAELARATPLETAIAASATVAPNAQPPSLQTTPPAEPHLLAVEDCPPIQVRCFGSPKVVCAGVQVWPRPATGEAKPWEFLLYLACQPTEGAAREHVAEALWPDDDGDNEVAKRIRMLRYRMRQAFSPVPGAPATDGICLDRKGVLSLDQTIVRSDAQQFLELVRQARTFQGPLSIPRLEQARALYTGHLLDAPDARRYAWVDERDSSGVTLREHFRRILHQATGLLADLYAEAERIDEAIEGYREVADFDPDDDHVWITLFQLHARRFDRPGLLREERRMRAALRALNGTDDENAPAESCEPSRDVTAEFKRLLALIDEHDSASATAV